MSGLILLTAPDCHFCQRAKAELAALGLEWREVDGDSDEGRQLAAISPPMRPVVFTADDRRMLAYGRVSLKRLRKQLQLAEAA